MRDATDSTDDIAALAALAGDTSAPLPDRHRAFGRLVARFQDVAFGWALAALGGDRAAAEDAAQEAFAAAWLHLPALREPAAFPGWLRRLVATRCGRRTRRKEAATPPLPLADGVMGAADGPHADYERRERAEAVRGAVARLPEAERSVVVLFYLNAHSRGEIAGFLGVSSVTVKKRLAAARGRLREAMWAMIEEEMSRQGRPSDDTAFAGRVLAFTKTFSALIDAGRPLVASLEELAARESDPEFRAVIEELARDIRAGDIPSRIMARHPRWFGPAYIEAIREGEDTGMLEVALARLAGGGAPPG
jgi:RNA polymerase sigma-70 factor (ECF subfamily)